MKNKNSLIILLSLLTLNFTQCKKKCIEKDLGTINLTQTDLNIHPYNGSETLIFKDSIGGTISYNSGFRKNGNYQMAFEHYDANNPDACRGDHCLLVGNYTRFYDHANGCQIRIDLYSGDPFSINKKSISINISLKDNTHSWFFGCIYYFDSLTLYNIPTTNIYNPPDGSILAYNDSLTIGIKKFYSVYTLIQNNNPYGLSNLKILYYSISKGIVGFKTENGHLWYLTI